VAVVAGFKDLLVNLNAHLEPFEGLLLRRPGGPPRTVPTSATADHTPSAAPITP
jgi:hypothetical protein